jgi:hypothetical protein
MCLLHYNIPRKKGYKFNISATKTLGTTTNYPGNLGAGISQDPMLGIVAHVLSLSIIPSFGALFFKLQRSNILLNDMENPLKSIH